MKESTLWRLSYAISTVMLGTLIYMWIQLNIADIREEQLPDRQTALNYLDKHWESSDSNKRGKSKELIKIKTGLFIQSIQFLNSNDVNLTGYIWQRYSPGQIDSLGLDSTDVGFIFPEQIESGGDIEPKEIYRMKEGENDLIGWYFEATLRQPFDYSRYPFDHQSIWLRMWPKNFADNVVLIPDYTSYESTKVTDLFGVEENIVLGEWKLMNTYFNYKLSSYSTDFGRVDYLGQENFPELHYNILVKRKVENAFFIYILPIFLVAVLLFVILLTVSNNEKMNVKVGFNPMNFVTTSSALFFVVMLAHIQLRGQFEGADIVYLDYFYILMYVTLVFTTFNVYQFSVSQKRWFKFLFYKDNLIPKISFWPFIIGTILLVTYLFM